MGVGLAGRVGVGLAGRVGVGLGGRWGQLAGCGHAGRLAGVWAMQGG